MCAITIFNNTASDVYVYNFNYGSPATVKPIGDAALASQKSLQLNLSETDQMRIYVSNKRLVNSLENKTTPCAPDPFNSNLDGEVLYSFAEYTYGSSQYTIDVSYINEFSFPLTLKFTNVPSGVNAQEGYEYGFTSLAAVATALKSHTDYSWDKLIWPAKPKTTWTPYYPDNMKRIIGPVNAWQQQLASPKSPIGPWEPDSYKDFIDSLPQDGTQLFTSESNWKGWNNETALPASTGYVKALHAAATPDNNGKYGFFCYPMDNASGEFTDLPEKVACTLTIYPFD